LLGTTGMWHYVLLYFGVIARVVVCCRHATRPLGLALLNLGGLPPFTGFIIKLRALGSLPL